MHFLCFACILDVQPFSMKVGDQLIYLVYYNAIKPYIVDIQVL